MGLKRWSRARKVSPHSLVPPQTFTPRTRHSGGVGGQRSVTRSLPCDSGIHSSLRSAALIPTVWEAVLQCFSASELLCLWLLLRCVLSLNLLPAVSFSLPAPFPLPKPVPSVAYWWRLFLSLALWSALRMIFTLCTYFFLITLSLLYLYNHCTCPWKQAIWD